MKTSKLLIGLPLFCLLCTIGLTACQSGANNNDQRIWDFIPFALHIYVEDAQGNDLLNPDTKGSIATQGIKAIYRDKTYEKDVPVKGSRATFVEFRGLQTYINADGKYCLTFGDFNTERTYNREPVEIDWNDGTKTMFAFSNTILWKANDDPVVIRKFFIDGKEVPSKSRLLIIK